MLQPLLSTPCSPRHTYTYTHAQVNTHTYIYTCIYMHMCTHSRTATCFSSTVPCHFSPELSTVPGACSQYWAERTLLRQFSVNSWLISHIPLVRSGPSKTSHQVPTLGPTLMDNSSQRLLSLLHPLLLCSLRALTLGFLLPRVQLSVSFTLFWPHFLMVSYYLLCFRPSLDAGFTNQFKR